MKTVDGVNYFNISEVGQIIERSPQTIKNWYKWASNNPDVKLPEVRRDLDGKGTYHFAESDIDKLKEFRDQINYGLMSDFNQTRWGKRGLMIRERRKKKQSQKD